MEGINSKEEWVDTKLRSKISRFRSTVTSLPDVKTIGLVAFTQAVHRQNRLMFSPEVDAAKFDVPRLKSAGMLTSEVLMMSKSRCHCKERGSCCSKFLYLVYSGNLGYATPGN